MSQKPKNELKAEIDRDRTLLRTLRDELRVKLHLMGMDARNAFARLEKEGDRLAHDVSEATHRVLTQLTEEAKELQRSISDKNPPGAAAH